MPRVVPGSRSACGGSSGRAFELLGIYRLRRSSSIFDDFVGFSLDSVESVSKLRVDLIEPFPNAITLGFEKIGCDSSANFIGGGGLSSRTLEGFVPLSCSIFISSAVLGV